MNIIYIRYFKTLYTSGTLHGGLLVGHLFYENYETAPSRAKERSIRFFKGCEVMRTG